MEDKREFLRHTVATLAYRATRALENAPEQFAGFSWFDCPAILALAVALMRPFSVPQGNGLRESAQGIA